MGLIQTLEPWYEQPWEAVNASSDSISDGLVFAWEGSNLSFDAAYAAPSALSLAGVSIGASEFGRSADFNGSQVEGPIRFENWNQLSGATGATYDILVRFNSANPSAKFFSQWDQGSEQRFTIECSSGTLVWVACDNNGGGTSRSRFDLSGAFPAAGWYRILATWRGAGNHSLFINGVLRSASTANSNGSVFNSTSGVLRLGRSATSALNGAIAFARIWRRGMSEDEARWRANSNPWASIFAPRTIDIPYSVASGIPTLSAPTFVPGSKTSTGWRGRITAT